LQFVVLELELFDILYIVRIGDDTVDGTDRNTLWFVIVSYTLRTAIWVDDIDRIVLFDGFVGTLFSTGITCNTLIVN
jgi:hypothetical protein